ncbi:hypothetical protein ALC62_04325 [Cyphomyrmex costatus]|uniref:Uncharacterized protein n=1 Tax=Cyphomyrmex costatus TaxID=456900 RepID=A0A195CXR1_9HYME|nr:hypothetical protein ALC62_04325 [Cyphomyrmex costatus]
MANRMRMLSVADSCEPVAERPYIPSCASTLSYSSSMTANPTSESNDDGREDVSKSRSSLGVISSRGLLGEHKKPRCIRSRLLYARSRKIQRYAIRGLCFVPLSRL